LVAAVAAAIFKAVAAVAEAAGVEVLAVWGHICSTPVFYYRYILADIYVYVYI
jgi:hypothetical protein